MGVSVYNVDTLDGKFIESLLRVRYPSEDSLKCIRIWGLLEIETVVNRTVFLPLKTKFSTPNKK